MNDLTVRFACEAVKSGIPASIIAFDSWFAVSHTISRLMKETKLTVIARLKTNSKQLYEYNAIFQIVPTPNVVSAQPGYLQRSLSIANGLSEAV